MTPTAPSVTMGVDLAAQPRKTAVCLLTWPKGSGPELLMLAGGRTEHKSPLGDKWIAATASGLLREYPGEVTKVGIDDPFGWPLAFHAALAAHREGSRWPAPIDEPTLELRFREADRLTQERSPIGRWPLSVSSDRIAVPAMRCAALLSHIAAERGKKAIARDGSGLCCEVYPDPAIRIWTQGTQADLGRRSYKGPKNARARKALLAAIRAELPISDRGGSLALVAKEDDYLDALVCALVARAAERGLTEPPRRGAQRKAALVEGWIHLPSVGVPLGALAG